MEEFEMPSGSVICIGCEAVVDRPPLAVADRGAYAVFVYGCSSCMRRMVIRVEPGGRGDAAFMGSMERFIVWSDGYVPLEVTL